MNHATKAAKIAIEKTYRVTTKYEDVVREVRRLAKRRRRNSATPFDQQLTDRLVTYTGSTSIDQLLERVTAPRAQR